MNTPNENQAEKHSAGPYEPKGNYFVFNGRRLIHVTEGWAKNWICYQHPDGQWVTLYHIPNSEGVDELTTELSTLRKELEAAKKAQEWVKTWKNELIEHCYYFDGSAHVHSEMTTQLIGLLNNGKDGK